MPPEMSFAGSPVPVERAFNSFGGDISACHAFESRYEASAYSVYSTYSYVWGKARKNTARNVTTVTRHEALCIRTDPATFPTADSYGGGIELKGRGGRRRMWKGP